MYKDVCKKISAFMLTVCLIVTMVEWPTTVWAGQGTVNTYRNGDGVLAGAPCETQAVAAVFTADRNADGAELTVLTSTHMWMTAARQRLPWNITRM